MEQPMPLSAPPLCLAPLSLQGRTCEHGAKCFFAHGEAELRRAAACVEADGDEAKVAVEGKPRLTTHEVEAMVSSGKLPASARTRLCKHFTQVWTIWSSSRAHAPSWSAH
jgi:hypothetical protein